MTETITVPIGHNATVDGGPFAGYEADGTDGRTDPENGCLYGSDQNDNEYPVAIEDLERDLADEMASGEPISLYTSDKGDAPIVGTIDLPLVDGVALRLHVLPGQGQDIKADLGNLRDDHLRRRHFERQLEHSSALIHTP